MKFFINAAVMALCLALSVADAGVLPIRGFAKAKVTSERCLAAGWVRWDRPAPQLRLGLLIRFDLAAANALAPSHPASDAPH